MLTHGFERSNRRRRCGAEVYRFGIGVTDERAAHEGEREVSSASCDRRAGIAPRLWRTLSACSVESHLDARVPLFNTRRSLTHQPRRVLEYDPSAPAAAQIHSAPLRDQGPAEFVITQECESRSGSIAIRHLQ
jgi:hypothetical protein